MKNQLTKIIILFLPFSLIIAQTPNNPWSIGLGANTIQIVDETVESKFGVGPTVSLSRYLGAGFSLGANYGVNNFEIENNDTCLLYTSPSPRDKRQSRMPSSA